MTRTQALRELRRMRFEEAYGGWQPHRLALEEAGMPWGVIHRAGAAPWRGARRAGL